MKYFVIFAIMFGPFNAFGIQTNEYSACLANTREHLADIDRMSLAYLQEGPAYTNSISPNEELARNIVLDELSTQHSYASRRRGQLLSQTVEKYKNVLAAGDMTQIHILAKEILESKIKSIVSDTSYSLVLRTFPGGKGLDKMGGCKTSNSTSRY